MFDGLLQEISETEAEKIISLQTRREIIAARGDWKKAREVLAKAPNIEAEDYDKY